MPGRLDRIDPWMDRLFSALRPKRYAHSLSVAWTSVRLAAFHGADTLRAEQAGLLHDCAKHLPLPEMQRIAREAALTDDQTILENPSLLHSVVGAWVAEHEYGMTDPEVLETELNTLLSEESDVKIRMIPEEAFLDCDNERYDAFTPGEISALSAMIEYKTQEDNDE